MAWWDDIRNRLPGAPIASQGSPWPTPTPAPPPAPVAGEGLPPYVLPSVPDFTTGTPVPGSGGSPTQAPVQRRGIDLPPHETPANRLQELENYEWQAKRLFDQAIADLSKANPEEDADAYQRLRTAATAAQSAYQAAQNAVTAETTREGQKKKPHTIEKREEGPPDRFGNTDTYLVTFKVDEQGNETWDQSVAPKLLTKRTGSPTAGQEVDLQTAQVGLQQAQQRLAAENDPLKKAQLQLAVDQARFTLQQAQATAPVDLATAQTNLAIAQQRLEEATSPEAKETARLAVEQARVALETSRQGLARGNAPQVVPTDTTSPVITTRDPTTGAISTQPNPAYQGPTFTDAVAQYNTQVPRLQQAARTERDRLLELQRQGALSEADAERQFQGWFGQHVETPLAGYRTAAEEAQRKEQRETEALQRAENARAEGLNRARETAGFNAGENARQTWMGLAGEVRTPQFLQQAGQAVANMSARAGAGSAEAAAALPRGSTFSADAFDPAGYAGVIPNLDEVAKAATQRALATISPSVAAQINAPMPRLPTGPTLQGMLSQIPYRGGLSQLPLQSSGLLPTPGMEAVDLAGERPGWARTHYGPTGGGYFDWQLPQ